MKMPSHVLASVLLCRASRTMVKAFQVPALWTNNSVQRRRTCCGDQQIMVQKATVPNYLSYSSGVKRSFVMRSTMADSSADSKSRAPFSAPKNSVDDSVTSDPTLLNDLSWSSLGLTDDLVNALKEMKLSDPTPVQRMTIPTILGGAMSSGKEPTSVSFAAATGVSI